MSNRFKAEVHSLSQKGITFADFLPEEVEDYLNAIRDCDKPFSGVNAELVGIPIKVCDGVYFWKLTIGASVWLDQFAKPWWLDKGQRKAYFWAIVYALIHGRDKGAFTEMTDEQTAYERIKADALKLVIQEDEITEAVEYALGLSNEEPKDNQRDREKAQQNWAEVISRLEAQSGIKADDWVWGRSLDYTKRAYIDLSRMAQAAGRGGVGTARMLDELDRATNRLALVKARIVGRILAEREARK